MINGNLLAGLGGAIVLTLLHESLKNVDDKMPRIDLVGEEAVQKATDYFGLDIKNEDVLYGTTLVGDLVGNAVYFSMINGEGKELWTKATVAGLFAGIGAVKLPSQMGLDDKPVTKSLATKVMTIGYYIAGALTTAGLLKLIEKKST